MSPVASSTIYHLIEIYLIVINVTVPVKILSYEELYPTLELTKVMTTDILA